MVPEHIVKLLLCLCLASLTLPAEGNGVPDGGLPPPFAGNPLDVMWERSLENFSTSGYISALRDLIAAYEAHGGRPLRKGTQGRVGLKIYSYSGSGLRTPPNLVRAVIAFLEESGFDRSQIFLIDLRSHSLRRAGFLPPVSVGGMVFEGVRIKALDSGDYFDPDWYYDNPLPSEVLRGRPSLVERFDSIEAAPQDRLSFLPVPLLLDVDFWINLPVLMDHPTLGVSAALANATVWNVGNQNRFLSTPASASVAVAEIAAIPELNRDWVFSLLSLERYQFLGGPIFNSLYSRSEPTLFLSANPGGLDYHLLDRLNRARTAVGFRRIHPAPRTFEYVRSLGLGDFDIPVIQVPAGQAPSSTE